MEPTFLSIAQSITQLGKSKVKWIYHERALAAQLGLSMEDFRSFIEMVETEGKGPPQYSAKVDLSSSVENNIGMYRIKHGRKSKKSGNNETADEVEPSLEASSAEGSVYYQIREPQKKDGRVNMQLQNELISWVVGRNSSLIKIDAKYAQTRQVIWKAWIMNDGTPEQKVLADLYTGDCIA